MQKFTEEAVDIEIEAEKKASGWGRYTLPVFLFSLFVIAVVTLVTLPILLRSDELYEGPVLTQSFLSQNVTRIQIPNFPLERREFEALTLENGMKILLISNPNTPVSGAAVALETGSLEESNELPGMAHFLEHLLFMGSEKYPEEDEFWNKISMYQGSANAFTANSYTGYVFTIGNDRFKEIIDVFAQFFISPLLRDSSVLREAKAVDNEYVNSLGNEAFRYGHAASLLMNPDSRPARFTVGSFEDLVELPKKKGINITEAVRKFYQDYYSSDIMSVVLLGRESIQELEEMAIKYFNQTQKREIKHIDWIAEPKLNSDSYMKGKVLKYNRLSQYLLRFGFILDDDYSSKYYKEKPLSYISGLINSEHKGGISNYLRQFKYFASGVGAHVWESSKELNYTMFNIVIDVNEYGFDHVDEITEIVFAYIKLIKEQGNK